MSNGGFLQGMKLALHEPETGPTLRRLFVNTIFDSTFVILGILIASAFSSQPNYHIVVATIVTSSVALGISTGVSVYEAESMEQAIKMKEMERAMLTSLNDTKLHKISKSTIYLLALVNLSAPILSGLATLSPFLILGPENIKNAAYISLVIAISILFAVGAMMGKSGQRNPWIQGARMAVAGIGAFIICFWIESLM